MRFRLLASQLPPPAHHNRSPTEVCMTQNPYAAPTVDNREGDALATAKRLDTLSRIVIVSCVLWFGMMIVGRFLDENAPPIRSMIGFYALIGLPSAFGLYGALSTLRRERYAMCLLGAACTSIPLFGPWCGLTVPIGIWTLILLRRPNVRSSFSTSLDLEPDKLDSADDVLAHAAHLDKIGEWEQAISTYRDAAERWPEHATYIDNCITEITSKQSAAT